MIESSKDFRIGEIDFHPFTIPHDAVDNFGFTATHHGVKIATVMDFGHITTLVTERLRGCAAIVIESNHSRDMLKACDNYPWELKQRILSRLGHLSNEDLADWIRKGFDGCAKYLVLAHLSQRANNPYLAKINAEVALQERAPLFVGFTEVSLSYPKAGRRVRLDHVGIFADGVAVREVGERDVSDRAEDGGRDRPRQQRRDLRGDQGRLRRHAHHHGAGGRAVGGRPQGRGWSGRACATSRWSRC